MQSDTEPEDFGEELDPVDGLLIELLAAGATHQVAGAAVGRSAKHVQRRMRDEAFTEHLRRRQRQRLDEATALLREGLVEAVTTIRANLQAERAADQLRAASLLISCFGTLHEQVEVLSTLDRLGDQLAEMRTAFDGSRS